MRLRPPELSDVSSIVALANARSQATDGDDRTSETEVTLWLTAPTNEPERNVRLAYERKTLCGYADVDPRGTSPRQCWMDLFVHPDADLEPVAAGLLDWATRRAAEEREPILRTYVSHADVGLKRFLEQRGFRLIRHSYRMEIRLDDRLSEPRWPEGIVVRRSIQGDERAVYDVHQETFADSWEHTTDPFDEWRHWLVESEGFDRTLWFLADAGGQLAGICLCRPSDRDADAGWVSILGVRRPWRRLGLGRGLLLHALREFRDRKFDRVALGVDATSLTGANRLYEGVGMRVARQFDFYERVPS